MAAVLFLQHPFMSQQGLAQCNDEAMVKAMLRFELALVAVQDRCGLIPSGTSAKLKAALKEAGFDLAAIADGVRSGGNPAIEFVKQGRALLPAELKRYWHMGATSQDVVDSALMLLVKPRLARVDELLHRCRAAAITLMRTHSETVMVGRTLMQQALPSTFGAKVSQWALGLEQGRRRLNQVRLPVQFGGAVGVHSGLPGGLDIMDALADELALCRAVLPWHTNRQPIHALGTALDELAGAAEKIALDISLLTQTEVGEVAEPSGEGMGESSSMPHKRNPVRCALIKGAARQVHGHTSVLLNAMAQPLERGLGEWHAEWSSLLESLLLVEGVVEQAVVLLEGIEVSPERMQRNVACTGGGIMAEPVAKLLAPFLGADEAKKISADAAEQARITSRPYADILLEHPRIVGVIEATDIHNATDPALYLGSSKQQVERAISWLDDN